MFLVRHFAETFRRVSKIFQDYRRLPMIYQSRPNISEDFKLLSSKVCEYFRIFFEDRKTINIPARPLGSCSVISSPNLNETQRAWERGCIQPGVAGGACCDNQDGG